MKGLILAVLFCVLTSNAIYSEENIDLKEIASVDDKELFEDNSFIEEVRAIPEMNIAENAENNIVVYEDDGVCVLRIPGKLKTTTSDGKVVIINIQKESELEHQELETK
ncbi:hypothetical protein KAW80_02030 [Candidatus Babeliales bacterium]|nr:hypothetical protein [Candidatus Babeliales bacterium]